MEHETVFKRDEGEISLLDHVEKTKKTFFMDRGEIDPEGKSLVKENVDFRWWYTDETDVVIETTHLPQYIEPTFLAMRETMEKAIAKHGKVVIEGNS